MKTFKVISWSDLPEGTETSMDYDLRCDCGLEAVCPTAGGGVIEARSGMNFITDPGNQPPAFFMPESIQCPKCKRTYSRQ